MDGQIHTKTYDYTMLEHMPIGVALFDSQDLGLLAANTLFHTFIDTFLDPTWKNGRAIGHSIIEYLPKAKETGVVAIFRRVAKTGIPYSAGEFAFSGCERGITYWNWTLDPIRDSDGRVVQLIQTATEITAQVLARQEAERVHAALSETNRIAETDRKRLEVIETVAHSVRESLDADNISMAAIKAVNTCFDALYIYIHIANSNQKTLDLLHIHPVPAKKPSFSSVQHIPYDSSFPIAQAYKQHNPIIIEDLQTAPSLGIIDSSNALVMSGAHGYTCVPLWFGDTFEGTLTAVFKECISEDGPEVQALVGSGMYIAAALAHARLHRTVENERRRLRAVLDQLPEGILITEASNGCISYANAAAANILGIPVTSLTGIPLNRHPQILTLIHDALPVPQAGLPAAGTSNYPQAAYKENIATRINNHPIFPWHFAVIRALGGETISSQEAMVVRPDGNKVITLSSSAPLRIEGGDITGAVIVFQDVTAQKSIEQQKNEFLSIASHELRTPITAIQGFAEILQMNATQEQSLSPQSLRALTFINEQSQSLTRLIEEMLDLTRIENAQLLLNLAPHDLISTIKHVIETQATAGANHNFQLVPEGLQDTDTLIGVFDENRFVQVLNNLISNAIKYSPAGSRIEVGLRYSPTTPHEALIWVKDSGIGIAANELPHIFKRFHRASGLDRSISGLGIGLYLVQEVVTRHRGRVWAESTEGSGSTFYVRLPLKSKQA